MFWVGGKVVNRMCKVRCLLKESKNNKGAVAVIVGIMLFLLIAFAAFAIDVGHFMVVRNELRNAADAGALAGARWLYDQNGQTINTNANRIAYDTARRNVSDRLSVDILWQEGQNNGSDIERGHWSFITRTFTPNDSEVVIPLWGVPSSVLDQDTRLINAVRVTARRAAAPGGTPAVTFLARIFGFESFLAQATSVAYIGYAGSLNPGEVDQPIAICEEAILDYSLNPPTYNCSRGRMINSGATEGHQTAGWTNFTNPCQTANAGSIRPYVCGAAETPQIYYGSSIGTTGGEVDTVFRQLRDCWRNAGLDTNGDGDPDRQWPMMLPVISCPGNNTGNCSEVRGAVYVNVVWMTLQDKNQMNEVPRYWSEIPDGYTRPANFVDRVDGIDTGAWRCYATMSGADCWSEFRNMHRLHDVLNDTPATYEDKTIYFRPDCQEHELAGNTGGRNFGVLARIPKLVD